MTNKLQTLLDEVNTPVMECVAYDIQSLFEASLAEDKTSIVLELGKKKLSESITNIHLPPGLYLFSGGSTGLGKSYFQQQRVLKNEAYACFSLLSIRSQQLNELVEKAMERGMTKEEADKFADKVLVKLESVELALNAAKAGKLKEFHFDEIQVTYEAGLYRIQIEYMIKVLEEMSKIIPVYCYSATYIEEFSMIDFDFTFHLQNSFRRNMVVWPVISEEQLKVNQLLVENPELKITDHIKGVKLSVSKQVAEAIQRTHELTSLRQVFFLNNEEIALEVAKELEQKGLTVEVVTSGRLKSKSQAPQAKNIMQCSEFKDYVVKKKKKKKNIYGEFEEYVDTVTGVDVIITTITMEAGININNKVAIGCLQGAPEKVFQQFGRARNDGYWYMICGQGAKNVKKEKVYRVSREYSVASKQCAFEDDELAACADGFSAYDKKCQLSSAASYVINRLDELGYTPDIQRPVLNESKSQTRSSAKKFKNAMLEAKRAGTEVKLSKIAETICCSTIKAEQYKAVYDKFNGFFTKDGVVDDESVDVVFDNLAFSKIQLFVELLEHKDEYQVITDECALLRKLYFQNEKSKENKPDAKEGNSEGFVEKQNREFWKKVFKVETAWQEEQINYKSYLQLFKILIGMVYKNGRFVMVPEKAFWDVPLEQGAESNAWNRINKAANKFDLTGGDICVETNLNRKELVNTLKVPAVKKIAKSIQEERAAIKAENISLMKF